MTAINSAIAFNTSTGSDTAASGVGPATAVSGTGASTNNTTTVDLSADTPDLSGVSSGDLLWVDSSSGRQFSVIASVDDGADTVTCDDTYTQTEGSRNWGIGGKRNDLDATSNRLLISTDVKPGFTIELETAQSISSALAPGVDGTSAGFITIKGTSAGTVLTQTANAAHIAPSANDFWCLENLHFQNTNGTKTSARGLGLSASGGITDWRVRNCIFGHATNTLLNGVARISSATPTRFIFEKCRFIECTGAGVTGSWGGSSASMFVDCAFHNCTGAGITIDAGVMRVVDCLFADNGGDGYVNTRNAGNQIYGSVFRGNTGDGIDLSSNSSQLNCVVRKCIFVDNGGYGVRGDSTATESVFVDDCGFYSNTSGETLDTLNGGGNITLTADPFVDAANDDFNINDTAGGGAVLRADTIEHVP